jgi:hypothetical protein
MTLTRATARTRVRFIIDDPVVSGDDGVRCAKADVEDALLTAMHEAFGIAVDAGANLFQLEQTITTSAAGVGALASLAPQRIVNVSVQQGGYRVPVPPLRPGDVDQLYTRAETLVVTYVPRPTFPAADGDAFVWGSASINLPQLDKLMVAIAASELKIVDAEVLGGLEARKAELVRAVEGLSNVPGWSVLPMTPRRQASLRYMMTAPDTLQLVYA